MFLVLKSTAFCGTRHADAGVFTPKGITRLLRMTFISGPRLLLTSRLSPRNASLMILLCAPALLLSAMLTIPSLIHPSPESCALREFARVLDQDSSRGIILTLATICAFIALAIPATPSKPLKAVRYLKFE
jgi:hypothetical protein